MFLPSALIAGIGLSETVRAGGGNFFSAWWQVADEVSPAAKLLVGGLLILAFLIGVLGHLKDRVAVWLVWNGLLAAAAMLAVVFLIPQVWSRGFGIGLSSIRGDPVLVLIYIFGGLMAGAVFTLTYRRCAAAGAASSARRLASEANRRQG